jgi:hypothetical protein
MPHQAVFLPKLADFKQKLNLKTAWQIAPKVFFRKTKIEFYIETGQKFF